MLADILSNAIAEFNAGRVDLVLMVKDIPNIQSEMNEGPGGDPEIHLWIPAGLVASTLNKLADDLRADWTLVGNSDGEFDEFEPRQGEIPEDENTESRWMYINNPAFAD
jgi:hypothetical protein